MCLFFFFFNSLLHFVSSLDRKLCKILLFTICLKLTDKKYFFTFTLNFPPMQKPLSHNFHSLCVFVFWFDASTCSKCQRLEVPHYSFSFPPCLMFEALCVFF